MGVGNLSDFDLAFALTFSVSIIAVVLTYIDMRRRLKQEREFSQSMANLINTLREELELSRKQSKTTVDIERQKILAQQGKQQWNQIKDIGKAIGWILEHAEENEN
jgi:pilus assembly protein TadC